MIDTVSITSICNGGKCRADCHVADVLSATWITPLVYEKTYNKNYNTSNNTSKGKINTREEQMG